MDDDELERTEEFFLSLATCSPDIAGIAQDRATKTVVITDDERRSLSNKCIPDLD